MRTNSQNIALINSARFGSPLVGRTYQAETSVKYRYSFNGKENDDETYGDGNEYDYGFRIYNPRLGRFLSVDPLFKGYPELTTYQFASNRPIDGIDLDGLEYLSADFARVEFVRGRCEIKVENFLDINKDAFNKANQNPENWTYHKDTKTKDIGIDQTVYELSYRFISPKIPEATDNLPKSAEGQTKTGAEKPLPSKDKGSKKETTHYGPNQKRAATAGRTMALIDGVKEAYKISCDLAAAWDLELIFQHKEVARKVIRQVNEAAGELKLIPLEYQTPERMIDIMNYVLQGVNNSNDPKIAEIGKQVFIHFNPAAQSIIPPTTVQYQQDNLSPTPQTTQPVKKKKR